MKVVLAALNAKYIHSSLAVRYIEKYCRRYCASESQLEVKEFSINEKLDNVLGELYKSKADLIAFSTYIWNRDYVLKLADNLKKVLPGLLIVLGGPEVSFDPVETMKGNPFIDIIVRGEGERTFRELLDKLSVLYNDRDINLQLGEIDGIIYQNQEASIVENRERELICDLDTIPRPYSRYELKKLKNKIIYYESSRGCPYNCSYCLSSTIKGVRSFSLERIKEDLSFYIDNKVKQLKFVDRTFNYDQKRTLEIVRFLVENKAETSFHFEITADILGSELLDYLKTVPAGLFQFEIGVQSTNKETLNLIGRKMNFIKLAENVKFLRKAGNIKLYLDLIAGLPAEDYHSFVKSFDEVYALNPHVLQLGFLKLLKGSRIRGESLDFEYKYTEKPPYEVLENRDISYGELFRLKEIEYILDRYHNSGVFTNTLRFIFQYYYDSCFSFYEDLARYFEKNNLQKMAHSRKALYGILASFYKESLVYKVWELDIFREILKLDFLLHEQGAKLPDWAARYSIDGFNDLRYRFLEREENLRTFLPHLIGRSIKEILREIDFHLFRYDVTTGDLLEKTEKFQGREESRIQIVLFDYSRKEKPTATNVSDKFYLNQ